MGVSADFLGKKVRCPHCREIVLAPNAAAPAGAPAPPPPPVAPPPAPAPLPPPVSTEPDLPQFNFPAAREGVDSILGDPNESEDDVFGTQPGTRLLENPFDAPQTPVPAPAAPPRPAPPLDLEATTTPDNPFALGKTEPAGLPRAPLPPAPKTTELSNPFPDLEPVSLPGTLVPSTVHQPLPPPAPPRAAPPPAPQQPVYAPPAAYAGAPSNPFAGIEESVVVAPPPAPVAERTEPVAPAPRARKAEPAEAPIARAPRARTPAKAAGGGGSSVLLYVALAWAVVATLLAVYGLAFRYGTRIDPGHPLSTVPDTYGEFGPAQRKNPGSVRVNGDLELPKDQRAQLGQSLKVGQLELTPKEIVRRRLMVVSDRGAGEQPPQPSGNALVMKLEITNKSGAPIFPMDPAFLRTSDPQNQPLTRLIVGQQTWYGGAIPWPFVNPIKRRREVQQQNDYEPLAANETREYVVFTDSKPDLLKAVAAAKDTMQWRVQVRSGSIDVEGKSYPVTSVFAVDFRSADITNPG